MQGTLLLRGRAVVFGGRAALARLGDYNQSAVGRAHAFVTLKSSLSSQQAAGKSVQDAEGHGGGFSSKATLQQYEVQYRQRL